MRSFFQTFWIPIYRWWGLRHIRKSRLYTYAGIRVEAPPGVFHPGVFLSTPVFVDFLKSVDFQGKTVLDVGTGTGMLALFAAKNGARATALDINPAAVEAARQNADRNQLPLRALESDLFERLSPQAFDFILVNPPYYPKRPVSPAEHAFFAGENLEYFEKFFAGLGNFRHAHTRTWFILSEDCDLEKIESIARRRGFAMRTVFERKKWGERLLVLTFE